MTTTGPVFFDHFGGLLVEHAGVWRSDRVLDLGARRGAVSVPALAAAGPQGALLAVHVSPAMVRRLSARLETTGHPDARAVVGDIGSLDLATGPVEPLSVLEGMLLRTVRVGLADTDNATCGAGGVAFSPAAQQVLAVLSPELLPR